MVQFYLLPSPLGKSTLAGLGWGIALATSFPGALFSTSFVSKAKDEEKRDPGYEVVPLDAWDKTSNQGRKVVFT